MPIEIAFTEDPSLMLAEAGEFRVADRALDNGWIYVWDDTGPASMTIRNYELDGVVQVGIVFTPPEQRGKGYASACVAELTSQLLKSGNRCLLYANLNNPAANRVYQQIG